MWDGGAINHRLIVTKDVTLLTNWYTKVAKGSTKVNDLVNARRAAMNSDPYVAVSTVACFLEYQSMGVWLNRCRIPVTEWPVTMS